MATTLVGRDEELGLIARFIEDVSNGPSALILEGDAGIGKTALWEEARSIARARGYRALSCGPAATETALPFAALADLLDPVIDDVMQDLPDPQRRALEIALLRVAPEGRIVDRLTLSVAALSVVRGLAARGPVVVAVDDAHWMDAPSAQILEFVARRLDTDAVGLLIAVRGEPESGISLALTNAMGAERVRRAVVDALDEQSLAVVVRRRLGVRLSPSVLRLVYQACGGNPFYGLEIARAVERGQLRPSPGAPLPVPENLRDLVRDRLLLLPSRAREVVVAVAALSEPTVEVVTEAVGEGGHEALDEAVSAGVIEIEDGAVRLTHPLVGRTAYAETFTAARRRLHLRLAAAVPDREERARHLALATNEPDESVASAVEEAARLALARGAPDAAADLAEQAIALTPAPGGDQLRRRRVQAAVYRFEAGDTARATSTLREAVASAPPGPVRADMMLHLARIHAYEDCREAVDLVNRALLEGGEDATRATVERDVVWAALNIGDLETAGAHSRIALELAEAHGGAAEVAEALGAVALTDCLLGRGIRADLIERADSLTASVEHLPIGRHPGYSIARVLKWTDDLDRARARFEALLQRGFDRGDESSIPLLLYHLSQVECWAGNWELAASHAARGSEAALQTGQEPIRALTLSAGALVNAHLGLVDQARREGIEGLELAKQTGMEPAEGLNATALGFLELSVGDPSEAHRHLGAQAKMALEAGVREPAFVRFMPDEIEALIALGDLDRATVLAKHLRDRARAFRRPWAEAASARCQGLLAAARGDLPGAARWLARALEAHAGFDQPFELARTLLVSGAVHRRAKRKSEARDALGQALAICERLGAPLWAERARAELARIGGRAPSPLALTPTEGRVADLVAAGRSNQEVADALFMSVRTVAANLTKIYQKLGVRSRTELAAWMRERRPV